MRVLNGSDVSFVSGGAQVHEVQACSFNSFRDNVVTGTVAGFIGGAVFGPGALLGAVVGALGGYAGSTAACLIGVATQ